MATTLTQSPQRQSQNIFSTPVEQNANNSGAEQSLSDLALAMQKAQSGEAKMHHNPGSEGSQQSEEELKRQARESQRAILNTDLARAKSVYSAEQQQVIEKIELLRQQLAALNKQNNNKEREKLAFTKNLNPGTGKQEDSILGDAISTATADIKSANSWNNKLQAKNDKKRGFAVTKQVQGNQNNDEKNRHTMGA